MAGVGSFIHWSGGGSIFGGGQDYDQDGRLKAGYSPSAQLRQWVFGWLAGIHSMTVLEVPQFQAWYHDREGKRRLTSSAENLKLFTRKALKEGLPGLSPGQVVEPFVPFALMFERHHGYSPGRDRIWWNTVPWGRDEDNVRAVLNAVWPNHEWCTGSINLGAWKTAPWESEAHYFHLRSEGLEIEDFEKGLMGDTPWGDTFDAITEDANPKLLSQYKVIVLVGGIKLHSELRIRLREYVEAGGILIVNAPQIGRPCEKLLGVELPHWQPGTRFDGLPFDLTLRDAEAVDIIVPRPIQSEVGMKHPAPLLNPTMLTRAKRGKGEVYLTTLDYGVDGAMELYTPFFNGLFKRFLPVRLESEQKESVGWMLNPLPKGWLLTVMNHGWNYWECDDPNAWRAGNLSKNWVGTAFFPDSEAPKNPTATDLWTGKPLDLTKCEGGWRVSLDVPPYGFVMCALVGQA